MRIVRHREDAEDVLQETLLRAYRNLDRFRGTCKFQTWIVRIGINSSLMLLRKRKVLSKVTIEPTFEDGVWRDGIIVPDSAPNPEQEYDRKQVRKLITLSVTRLRRDFRCLLERHYRDGHSVSDVAIDLGISTAAAKARMHRARKLLKVRLTDLVSPPYGGWARGSRAAL